MCSLPFILLYRISAPRGAIYYTLCSKMFVFLGILHKFFTL
nr:MAG TPA: hypothetical protein [Bacteriophage sp.]